MARPRKDAGAVPADRRILNEFSQMVLEKPLAEITVDALCRKAKCNKTTFYYHYATFSDVVERYLEEFDAASVLECALGALLGEGNRSLPSALLREEDRLPPRALLGEGGRLPLSDGSHSTSRGNLASLPRRYDELCLLVAKNPHGLIHDRIEEVTRHHAAAVLGAEGKAEGEDLTMRREMLVSFTAGGIMRLLAYRGEAGNAIAFEEMVNLFYPEIFPAIIKATGGEG